MAVLIFLGCLLGGIAIGLPIAWALLLCGAALMFFVRPGEIMNAGGLSKRIVDLPMKLVGHKPGGLGYVGVLAAMIMASLSGSAVADTAAVAALLVPMMRSANYPVNRAAGLIASGGIIAPIIPPSIPFIIFGVSSGLSISKLFMAGIAPGMMMGATLMLTWWCLPGGGRPVALIYPASKKQRCRKSGTLLSPVSGRCFFQSSLLAGFAPVCLPLPKPGPLLLSMRCLSPQLFTVK